MVYDSEYYRNCDKLMKDIKEYRENNKICMADKLTPCGDIISECHTISRQHLKKISHDENIVISSDKYTFMPFKAGKIYEFLETPLSQATTIPIFCNKHDYEICESFEKNDFSGTPKQIFDLTFRSLTREIYLKRIHTKTILNSEFMEKHNKTGYIDSEAFINRSLQHQEVLKSYEFLNEHLTGCNEKKLSSILYKAPLIPIALTGVLLRPLEETYIEELKTKYLGCIYNIFPVGDSTYFVFSTVKIPNHSHHEVFFEELSSYFQDENAFNKFIENLFTNSNNIAMNPFWYKHLDSGCKISLDNLLNYSEMY
jgi:hypothetical protein